jgi:transcription elongation factor Elf1
MTNTKPILATCDAGCKKEFRISKFKTKKVKNGIEKTYFKCPHCKHEYIAFYASAETLKLQKEMRKLYVKMRNTEGIPYGNEYLEKETEFKMKIRQSMDEARRIAEG